MFFLKVQALIHQIQNNVGPSYFPPVRYHEALSETDLTLQCLPVGAAGSGSGGYV